MHYFYACFLKLNSLPRKTPAASKSPAPQNTKPRKKHFAVIFFRAENDAHRWWGFSAPTSWGLPWGGRTGWRQWRRGVQCRIFLERVKQGHNFPLLKMAVLGAKLVVLLHESCLHDPSCDLGHVLRGGAVLLQKKSAIPSGKHRIKINGLEIERFVGNTGCRCSPWLAAWGGSPAWCTWASCREPRIA